MPTKFQKLLGDLGEPEIDSHFGEPVTFTPMTKTANGRAAPDPNRDVVEAVAVVERTAGRAGLPFGARTAGGRQSNALRSIVSSGDASISVCESAFPISGDRPRQGDHVQVDCLRFEVVSVQPDGTGRPVLALVRLGPA